MVRVRDKTQAMETLLQPMDFLNWIYRLRNCDVEDSIKELRDFDCDWETYDETEVFEDSLNSSRISINIAPVKKQLNESVHQFSMDGSMLEATLHDQTSIITLHNQQEDINACLTQIEVATKTLNKLCHQSQTYDTKPIVESLTKMQNIVEILKNTLQNKDFSESDEMSTNSISSANDTVIDMLKDIKNTFQKENLIEFKEKSINPTNDTNPDEINKTKSDVKRDLSQNISPTKSSLRNNAVLDTKASNTQKNVKFDQDISKLKKKEDSYLV